jgi:DNA-binding transcriptional LysR family regulator
MLDYRFLPHSTHRTMNSVYDRFVAAAAESLPARGQVQLRGADLPLLVSLDVLLEECNVTRAAVRLHLSQPALSAQLSRLRQLFDDPLLVPSGNGRGLVPSQFAINLHRRLKPALATLSAAVQINVDGFRPGSDARCFTIAATNTAAAMVMPALLGKIQAYGNRGLRFVTAEPDYAKLGAQLEKGEIDLCVGAACLLPPGLTVAELVTTPHVLAQRRGHPHGTAPVTLTEYCQDLEHINVARDSTLHGYLDEQLYRQGHARHVTMAVRDFSIVPALLKSTDLVCTLPAHLAHAFDADLELRSLAFPLSTYALCVAWHPRGADDAGLAWLRDELQGVMRRD